jgi:hypothetical protein
MHTTNSTPGIPKPTPKRRRRRGPNWLRLGTRFAYLGAGGLLGRVFGRLRVVARVGSTNSSPAAPGRAGAPRCVELAAAGAPAIVVALVAAAAVALWLW